MKGFREPFLFWIWKDSEYIFHELTDIVRDGDHCERRFYDEGVFHQIGGGTYRNDHIILKGRSNCFLVSMGERYTLG